MGVTSSLKESWDIIVKYDEINNNKEYDKIKQEEFKLLLAIILYAFSIDDIMKLAASFLIAFMNLVVTLFYYCSLNVYESCLGSSQTSRIIPITAARTGESLGVPVPNDNEDVSDLDEVAGLKTDNFSSTPDEFEPLMNSESHTLSALSSCYLRNPSKFCFIRCLEKEDRVIFIRKYAELLDTNCNNPDRINEIILSGSMKMYVGGV
mmetsp:Transcript_3531/g.3131  ORF Transcript_3531/g.3131 Transcript_3531/m.3131 type:complete len:207 (-) Transcript_3531:427-1047(-)